MRIVDLNLLLYAVNADDQNHAAARSWWERASSMDAGLFLLEHIGNNYSGLDAFGRVVEKPHRKDRIGATEGFDA